MQRRSGLQEVIGERVKVDEGFVSRLLMGALTPHEQRMMSIRLLAVDDRFRDHLRGILDHFSMFDADLATRYDRAVADGDDPEELARLRRRLQAEAHARRPHLHEQALAFLAPNTRNIEAIASALFTWSMAEILLANGQQSGLAHQFAKINFDLAETVIDAVEVLSTAGPARDRPDLVRDVRRRLRAARITLADRPYVAAPSPIGDDFDDLDPDDLTPPTSDDDTP
ncbi:MAG: hypothetical protein AAF772_20235 [Acidobacteriota bacterium]